MKVILILLFISWVQCSHHKNKWDDIIEKVNSAGTTWTAGYNFHPSTTPQSLKSLLGAKLEEKSGPYKEDFFELNDNDEPIPNEFDARKQWEKCKSIGQIRDQGDCGSCWAIAAAEAFTDRICVATNGRKNPTLSVEDLLTCCNDCGFGCEGGSPWFAWHHFKRFGIVSGGDYHSNEGCKPYSLVPCEHHVAGQRPNCKDLGEIETPECHYKCSNKHYHKSYFHDKYKASEFYVFRSNETELLQRDILKHGPVEASFKVYEDFYAYKSGVYQHITGQIVGGHAVKVIGWGVENDVPYWLVANSWNTDWGDNGYFKIKRGNNECRFENFMLSGQVANHHIL